MNHKIVSINERLNNGDQIEILSSKKQKPSEDWIQYAATSKARSCIKDFLNDERRRIIAIGKKSLENIFRDQQLQLNQQNTNRILDYFKITSPNELYYSIGVGNFKWSDMEHFVKVGTGLRAKNKSKPNQEDLELSIKHKLQHNAYLAVTNETSGEIDYNLAECCKPIPGDEVFGYVNKNGDIEVHRSNCSKAINSISKFGFNIVRTKWTKQHKIAFLTGIKITGMDDVGVVFKITTVISGEQKVNMQSLTIESDNGIFQGFIKVFVKDTQQLSDLMDHLRTLEGILSVSRWEEDQTAK